MIYSKQSTLVVKTDPNMDSDVDPREFVAPTPREVAKAAFIEKYKPQVDTLNAKMTEYGLHIEVIMVEEKDGTLGFQIAHVDEIGEPFRVMDLTEGEFNEYVELLKEMFEMCTPEGMFSHFFFFGLPTILERHKAYKATAATVAQ